MQTWITHYGLGLLGPHTSISIWTEIIKQQRFIASKNFFVSVMESSACNDPPELQIWIEYYEPRKKAICGLIIGTHNGIESPCSDPVTVIDHIVGTKVNWGDDILWIKDWGDKKPNMEKEWAAEQISQLMEKASQ